VLDMKNLMIAAAAATALVIAAPPLSSFVSAQSPPRASRLDPLLLETPGASIGASVRDLQTDEADRTKITGGAYIEDVRAGSPADRAGFRRGDIVVEFDGERVRSARHLTRLVRESAPGRALKATVSRDGSRRTLDITPDAGGRVSFDRFPDIGRQVERGLRNLPRDFSFDFEGPILSIPMQRSRLGVMLMPLDSQLADYFGASNGVLVSSVTPDSPAARGGLKAGDVIIAANGKPIENSNDLTRAIREVDAGGALDLRVVRDKKEIALKATLPDRGRPRRAGRTPV
jgi:serine protease Do